MQDPFGVVHLGQEVGESSASFAMGNILLVESTVYVWCAGKCSRDWRQMQLSYLVCYYTRVQFGYDLPYAKQYPIAIVWRGGNALACYTERYCNIFILRRIWNKRVVIDHWCLCCKQRY